MPHPEDFFTRVRTFNTMYRMETVPEDAIDMLQRLEQFGTMLAQESEEIKDIISALEQGDTLEARTRMADWLCDIMIYCASECLRWRIPTQRVLDIIMDSNASKLQADGSPLFVNGKLQKGPNYWKPESKIKELLNDQDTNGA